MDENGKNGKINIKNDLNTSDYFTFLCEKISKFLQPSKKMEK